MKNFVLVIFTILFVVFSPSTLPSGCDDYGTKETQECIKDSNGNCVKV